MEHNTFNQFCGSMIASTYVMQWGNSHVWKVGGKVFAIGTRTKEGQIAYTFKASPRNFEFLREHEGYRPAPYFATRGMKWIQQTETSGGLDEELEYYLTESYKLVASGLSKRKQKELGLETLE